MLRRGSLNSKDFGPPPVLTFVLVLVLVLVLVIDSSDTRTVFEGDL